MIQYLILILVIIVFLLASYEDIKKREIYDYINYSLVFLVLVSTIFYSMYINSFNPLKYVGFGLLIGFALGSMLYYSGIWGGGDAKFLIGFSASSYYLMNFVTPSIQLDRIYDIFKFSFSGFFEMFLNFFLKIIIGLDTIFIFLIIIKFLTCKDKNEKKNQLFLLLILSFLFLGLYLAYGGFNLILLGFIAFVLIFFAEGSIFNSVFFIQKKRVDELVKGDKIDTEIKIDKKILIDRDTANEGIGENELIKIKENYKEAYEFNIRKVLPYGILVALNYVIYVLRIISIDDVNQKILLFLLQFLFYSFIAGGILSIFIILTHYIMNMKKIKLEFSRLEKSFLFTLGLSIVLLSIFYNLRFIIWLLIILIYPLIKIAKKVENLLFIKKKKLETIVPGDWIVQDITINKKTIYSIEDFKLGINENQIAKLKILSKKYPEIKNITVKDGIPFLPPLFIGFIILIFIL